MDNSTAKYDCLTTEELECLAYKRARHWSKFLNSTAMKEDDEILDLNNIEDNFKDYKSEDESEVEMAIEVDPEKEDEENTVLDITALAQNITVSDSKGVLSQLTQNMNSTQLVSEDREFLEQTLPIYEEHKRKWRKAGIERILNTFDDRTIEEKVGKWMLRNNSMTFRQVLPNNDATLDIQVENYKINHFNQEDSSSECDSTDSDSIDTARYIRSSKKNCSAPKRYSTKTTTIKSFCTLKGKRDELRRKYAYLVTDETMQQLCNTERRHCGMKVHHNWDNGRVLHRTLDDRRIGYKSQSMKKLRAQRKLNSSLSTCSSSDEKAYYRGHTPSNCNRHRMCNDHRNICSKSMFCSRSQYQRHGCECSSYGVRERERYHRRKYCSGEENRYLDFMTNSRQRGECNCGCKTRGFLTDSSGDSWIVEEFDRTVKPKSVIKKFGSLNELVKFEKNKKAYQHSSSSSSDDDLVPRRNNERKLMISNKPHKSSRVVAQSSKKNLLSYSSENPDKLKDHTDTRTEARPLRKSKLNVVYKETCSTLANTKKSSKNAKNSTVKTKSKEIKKMTNTEIEEEDETTDDFELQLALKTSKELYEAEIKKQLSSQKSTNDGKQNKNVKSTPTAQKGPEKRKNQNRFVSKLNVICSESEPEENSMKHNITLRSKPSTKNESENKNQKEILQNSDTQAKTLNLEQKKVQNVLVETGNKTIKSTEKEDVAKPKRNTKQKQTLTKNNLNSKLKVSFQEDADKSKAQNKSRKRKSSNENENKILNLSYTTQLGKLNLNDSVNENSGARTEKSPLTVSSFLSENTTFFANPGKMCNSTALGNNTAMSRQILSNYLNQTTTTPIHGKIIQNKNQTTTTTATTTTSKTTAPKNTVLESVNGTLSTDSSDCQLVTSTSEPIKKISKKKISNPQLNHTTARVVIYTPNMRAQIPQNSLNGERFRIAEEFMSGILGQGVARKFMKFYNGKKEFKLTSSVYYHPPRVMLSSDSSTNSENDFLDSPNVGYLQEIPLI